MYRNLGLMARGRSPADFRRSALFFIVMTVPLLLLWLYEGGYLFSYSDVGSVEWVTRRTTAVHRLTGWALPVLAGVVFAYGIAQTEPDPRLAAMGVRDVRRLWLHRWLPVGLMILVIVGCLAWVLAAHDPALALRAVPAAIAATAFIVVIAFAVVVRSGLPPGGAAAVTLVLLIPALVAPLVGAPPYLSISPGPLGWLRGAEWQPVMFYHSLAVLLLALCILAVSLYVPRDARRLGWIAHFGRKNDA